MWNSELHSELQSLIIQYGKKYKKISSLLRQGDVFPQLIELYFHGLLQAARNYFTDRPKSTFYVLNGRSAQMWQKSLSLWIDLEACLQHRPLFQFFHADVDLPCDDSLPPFWIPGLSDELLLEGVAAHGLDSADRGWAAYLRDAECPFYSQLGPLAMPLPRAQWLMRGYIRRTNLLMVKRIRALLDIIIRQLPPSAAASLSSAVFSAPSVPGSSAPASLLSSSSSSSAAGQRSPAAAWPNRDAISARMATRSSARYAVSADPPAPSLFPPYKKRPLAQSSSASASSPASSSTSSAFPQLPYTLSSGVTIVELGTVEYRRPGFHTDRYIWPAGFRSFSWHPSCADPSEKVRMWFTIEDSGDSGPLFTVTSEEFPDGAYSGNSPTGAWTKAARWLWGKQNVRNGPQMFGLNDLNVRRMIQTLPNASKCVNYEWYYGATLPGHDLNALHPKKRLRSKKSQPVVVREEEAEEAYPFQEFDSEETEKWLETIYAPHPIPGFSIYNVAKRLLANVRMMMEKYPIRSN